MSPYELFPVMHEEIFFPLTARWSEDFQVCSSPGWPSLALHHSNVICCCFGRQPGHLASVSVLLFLH